MPELVSELARLPEGMELELVTYLVKEGGTTMVVRVRGLTVLPPRIDMQVDVAALLRELRSDDVPPGAWRVMTRAEIAAHEEQDRG